MAPSQLSLRAERQERYSVRTLSLRSSPRHQPEAASRRFGHAREMAHEYRETRWVARTPSHEDVQFWRDPLLPGVELRLSMYRKAVFRDHTHPTYSVGLIDDGSASFALLGQEHRAIVGQLVVIDPHEPHSCSPDPGSVLAYRMFYLDPSWFSHAANAPMPEFTRPVVDDPDLFAAWSELYAFVLSDAPAAERTEALHIEVSRLVADHADTDERFDAPSDVAAVEVARQLLLERFAERVTLDELASAAGVSRSHLSRAFRQVEGLPPHTYQNQLRIQHAKSLLASGANLGDAASGAGFADQSHFTRVFREFTGATPGQYQDASTRG